MFNSQCSILSRLRPSSVRIRIKHWEIEHWSFLCVFVVPNPSIRGVGAPMDGLSASPWTARWCQGTLPWPWARRGLTVNRANLSKRSPLVDVRRGPLDRAIFKLVDIGFLARIFHRLPGRSEHESPRVFDRSLV